MLVVPAPAHLGLFAVAALALLLTPGPAVLYIVTRSIDQGRRAGLVSILGIHVGTLVHLAASAAGLSALLAASAMAFGVVKYAGAAYLVYLGLRRMFDRTPLLAPATAGQQRLRRAFVDGVVVNVLNPKTALFFLAFLPQFVDESRGSLALQVVVLGLLFITLGLITDGAYAITAGTAAGWLRRHPRVVGGDRFISGGVYIGLGVVAALSSAHRK